MNGPSFPPPPSAEPNPYPSTPVPTQPGGPPPTRSKGPLVIGGIVVAALVAGLVFLLTKSDGDKSDTKDTTEVSVDDSRDPDTSTDPTNETIDDTKGADAEAALASCRGVSAAVDAMKSAQRKASGMDPKTDADVPAAKEVLLELLDDGALAAIEDLRPVVGHVALADSAGDVTEQAGEYLTAMEQAEKQSKATRDAVDEASTIDELMEAVSTQVSGKPLSLKQDKYAAMTQAIRDIGDDCSTAVDDLNSSSATN